MVKDLIDVHLNRENNSEPWGFRLSGGKDQGQPLQISQVVKDSLTQKAGLLPNDFLISVAGGEVYEMTHDQAERAIQKAGDRFTMVIERVSESTRKISFEKSATQFALRLGAGTPEVVREAEAFVSNIPFTAETPSMAGVNFKKYEKTPADISASHTLEDVSKKANLQKDWNCPWVSKDGSRLKQAIRYVDEPVAQASTSHQHYYSQPGSILAPEPQISKEQLEALIREHGQDSRPESRAQQQTSSSKHMYHEEQHEETLRQEMSSQYCHEREEDSQAPPELEPINLGYEQFQQQSMGGFGQETGYEPSADELIDVLKNLENLAAADPQLYRTIVDQIKGGAMGGFFQQATSGNGQASQYEQQMYEQQQREAQIYEQQQQQQMQMQMEQQRMYEEQQRMMQQQEESSMQQQQQQSFSSSSVQQQQKQQTSSSSSSMRQEQSSSMRQEQSSSMQMQQETKMTKKVHQVTETASSLGMSEEEFKQHSRMKRLEAEAQEEVRQTLAAQREAKMKKLHPPAPPPPKEITVVAGDGKSVKIHLGGEKELEDCRRQVAEAAGLKHVALPEFENADGSAWAGSLKKTNKNRPVQEAEDENPWAGSLRHVDEQRKGKAKKDEKEDTYGNAPWMGTLRHVVHDNKVTRNYGVNQFQSKRYPDEDAGNPFESNQGSNSRPQFPLTPAAIINGSAMTRDEMARREEEEEVERIRSNIGTKTVSTALLQALMPKLLKMHEAKYEPMDKVDAEKIMEEILGMKAGLNPDQQADANEEAEMIIRAIMQEEVDKSIYSKMADDLETANKRIKKKKSKKIGQNPSAISA
jgi:hypothetical protein